MSQQQIGKHPIENQSHSVCSGFLRQAEAGLRPVDEEDA
jgi:hypothetical protein